MAEAAVSFLLENVLELISGIRKRARAHDSFSSSSNLVRQLLDELKLGNQVQRVPPLFRNAQAHQNAYDPVIVSLGPYHHDKILTLYHHAQSFKQVSLDAFLSDQTSRDGIIKDKFFFHKEILQRIQDVRGCYEDVVYNDEDLAWLILSDACFFIYHLQCLTMVGSEWKTKFGNYYSYFGPARLKFIDRDLLLLENQIPFWVIELLLRLQSSDDREGQSNWNHLLSRFMKVVISGEIGDPVETTLHVVAGVDTSFHLLGAYYQALKSQIPVQHELPGSGISIVERNPRKSNTYRFRSITNLKSKGIRLILLGTTNEGPNTISFTSHTFYGQLHLPPLVFPTNFFVLYSNLIAYEMSPNSNTNFFVSSLVNLMKSLIESPNDVMILREKGILFNDMVSDDEVVKVIKELDTFGLENIDTFLELRYNIESHCCSKAKTWAAELIHTYFESPWKIIALLAAFLLLCLSFLQTLFTIHPAKSK